MPDTDCFSFQWTPAIEPTPSKIVHVRGIFIEIIQWLGCVEFILLSYAMFKPYPEERRYQCHTACTYIIDLSCAVRS